MAGRIAIEKNVPLPPQTRGPRPGAKRRWPFRKMVAGDSFLVPTHKPEAESRRAYSAAKRVGAHRHPLLGRWHQDMAAPAEG